jgi:cytochrome o ubiquinol oxidase subunit 1
MGAGANVNAFFGITTMIISIPTGVKIFNWLFTMYRGRVRFTTPVLWTLGFMVTFVIGGMTGVLMAVPAADFVLHNSLFLIAHFHNVIIGGVLFGYLAGFTYWFPKAFGFKLDEKTGKAAFWCWLVGFYVAFMPLYALGFMGMTRRLNHYDNPAWHPFLVVAFCGALIVACGIFFQILQIVVSVKNRHALRDTTGDPWGGRTLEWATASPPAFYNFAKTPVVKTLDALAQMKLEGEVNQRPAQYADIHMPRNTPVGLVMAGLLTVMGFALVWHIWWLAAFGLVGAIAAFIARTFDEDIDYYVPAAEVERIEGERFARLAAADGAAA